MLSGNENFHITLKQKNFTSTNFDTLMPNPEKFENCLRKKNSNKNSSFT